MKTKDGFVCTDADLSVGKYGIAPRDPKAFHQASNAERDELLAIARALNVLKADGWKPATYAPKDTKLLLIEPGSCGIHEGYRDALGFWIYDGDTWPSDPILWKLAKPREEQEPKP